MNAPSERALTVGLVLTVTLVGFESLAVATATPAINAAFPGGGAYGFVLSSFMVGNLVGTLAAGAAIDRRGLLAPYLVAMALFGGALGLAAMAPTLAVLVAARAIQGVGGGAIMALGYATIRLGFDPARRSRIFALLSLAWLLPGLVGPAIAALVTERFGFRPIFAGILPLVVVALAITGPSVARLSRALARDGDAEPAPPVDVARLRGALALRAVQAFAYFALDAFVPALVHDVLGRPHRATALAVTVASIAWAAAAWLADRALPRRGARALVRASFALVLVGALLLAASAHAPYRLAIGVAVTGAAVAGFGVGLGYGPLSVVLLAHAPEGHAGKASSAMTLVEMLAVAIASALGGAAIEALGAGGVATAAGVSVAFGGAAIVAVAGLVVATRATALDPERSPA